MPKPFEYCNKQKGRVDLLDQFVSTYRVCIRSKKWWLLFLAWAGKRFSGKSMELLHCREAKKWYARVPKRGGHDNSCIF